MPYSRDILEPASRAAVVSRAPFRDSPRRRIHLDRRSPQDVFIVCSQRHDQPTINRHWQNQPTLIIDMLANQIHTPGRDANGARFLIKLQAKGRRRLSSKIGNGSGVVQESDSGARIHPYQAAHLQNSATSLKISDTPILEIKNLFMRINRLSTRFHIPH